jgi:uncharacterized membrane protein (DUF106 family)
MVFIETLTAFLQQNALLSLTIICVVLSLATTLVYKHFTDQSLIRQIREDIKKYQEQMKQHKGDAQKQLEIQSKMTELNMKMMPQTFKPMIITMIPFLLIFTFLNKVYLGMIIIPLPFWEGHLGYIGTYIILSMIFSTLFRKWLKVV